MNTGREDVQMLVFELAPQRYALPIACIREVLPLATLIHPPQAPAGLAGILRLRGALVPIVDLRYCLRLPAIPPALDHRIIVTRLNGEPLGFQVDAVHGLLTASRATQHPNGLTRSHAVDHLFNTPDGVVMLLDADDSIGAELKTYLAETMFSEQGTLSSSLQGAAKASGGVA